MHQSPNDMLPPDTKISHRITPSNIQSCLNVFLILNVRVMIKSDWDLHLWHWLPGTSGNGYESLHRGNIPTSKTQCKSLSLFLLPLLLSQYINNNITHSEPKKNYPHIGQDSTQKWWSSNSSCVDPLLPAMLLLRQAARISPLINCRTGPFDTSRSPWFHRHQQYQMA